MPNIQLIISVDDAYVDRILEVLEKLQNVGMNVEEFMPALGVVTGSIDNSKIELLAQVDGVAHVEPSTEFRIPEVDI